MKDCQHLLTHPIGDQEKFGILGPDGPDPARDILVFEIRLRLATVRPRGP